MESVECEVFVYGMCVENGGRLWRVCGVVCVWSVERVCVILCICEVCEWWYVCLCVLLCMCSCVRV